MGKSRKQLRGFWHLISKCSNFILLFYHIMDICYKKTGGVKMQELRNLADLERYKCPKLDLVENNIAESHKELIFCPELSDNQGDLFRSEFDSETLKQGKIIIKTFNTDQLLPFSYQHRNQSYPSYSNFISCTKEYDTLHLMKIKIEQGVRVLKPNDHQHFHDLVLQSVVHHFYYDFDDPEGAPRWKIAKRIDAWEEERSAIETFKKSHIVSNIIKNYFLAHDLMKDREYLQFNFPDIFRKLMDFYQLKNLLNEINDEHFILLKQQIDAISGRMINISMEDSLEYKKTEQYSQIHNHFTKDAYFVANEKAYPNTPLFFRLHQQAKEFRSDHEIKRMEKAAVLFSAQKQKTTVYISLPEYQKIFSDLKK